MKTIKLTKGKVAIIDDEDFEIAQKYKWHFCSNGYAATNIWGDGSNRRVKYLYLHKLILPDPGTVDHANRNKLDNRRKNLRLVTPRQNSWNAGPRKDNKSGIKGVFWCKQTQKWRVRAHTKGKTWEGGRFKTIDEARKRAEQLFLQREKEFQNGRVGSFS